MSVLVVMYIALFCTGIQQADCVNYTVIDGLPSEAFRCSKTVTLTCYAKPGSTPVRWHIDYNVQTSSDVAAFCQDTGCDTLNNFNGRYSFTYDKPSGISNLTIRPVTSEDDKRGYICNDFELPQTFTAHVKSFPGNDTSIESDMVQKTLTVSTGCTFNAGNVTFSWFKLKDGNKTALSNIGNTTPTHDVCPSPSACNGILWKSTINTTALENIEGKYSIEYNILFSDPDAPGPIVKVLDDVINSGGNSSQVSGLSNGNMVLLSVLIFRTIYWTA